MFLSQDLSYSIPSNVDKKELAYLLQNVSGYLETGQMTALVRPDSRCLELNLSLALLMRCLKFLFYADLHCSEQ